MREHLLSPSLSDTRPTVRLYSPRSSFLLGFFMGPLPLVLYSALNSVRLKRPLDALAYVLATALSAALIYASFMQPQPEALAWFNAQIGEESMRTVSRILAIVLWGSFYLMHRKEHRTAELFGESPSPWIPAIACAALGFALTVGLAYLLKDMVSV
jgi:hypothetical protein